MQLASIYTRRGLQYQRETYLDSTVDAKFADLARGPGAVAARVRSGQGGEYARRLRDELSGMTAAEQALLVERTGRRGAMIRRTDRTVMVANALALLAGLLARSPFAVAGRSSSIVAHRVRACSASLQPREIVFLPA